METPGSTEPIPLNQPIRFLAVRWGEGWEFDCLVVLLEPVFRYESNGHHTDQIIEDVACDITAYHGIRRIEKGPSPADVHEFAWREWDMDALPAKAESLLRGEKVDLGVGDFAEAREQWIEFYEDGMGDIRFREVAKPVEAAS